jgi:uncharacterized protein YutE (UPF0331/DUF86 family)
MLIELAESISNTLQHILAKEKGIPVSGYIDTIVKGKTHGIISENLYDKLKPFLDFRNSLVHRYWTIDDSLLIRKIVSGCDDFFRFTDEIESYLKQRNEENTMDCGHEKYSAESYGCSGRKTNTRGSTESIDQ